MAGHHAHDHHHLHSANKKPPYVPLFILVSLVIIGIVLVFYYLY